MTRVIKLICIMLIFFSLEKTFARDPQRICGLSFVTGQVFGMGATVNNNSKLISKSGKMYGFEYSSNLKKGFKWELGIKGVKINLTQITIFDEAYSGTGVVSLATPATYMFHDTKIYTCFGTGFWKGSFLFSGSAGLAYNLVSASVNANWHNTSLANPFVNDYKNGEGFSYHFRVGVCRPVGPFAISLDGIYDYLGASFYGDATYKRTTQLLEFSSFTTEFKITIRL